MGVRTCIDASAYGRFDRYPAMMNGTDERTGDRAMTTPTTIRHFEGAEKAL